MSKIKSCVIAGIIACGVATAAGSANAANWSGVNEDGQTAKEYYYQNEEELTEIPDELTPYAKELERINTELGTDYALSVKISKADEAIDFFTSMTVEEFHDYIYGLYKSDIANPSPFERYKMTETNDVDDVDIVNHNGGFWYFSDNAPAEPDNDHKVEGAILDENGEIGVIPHGELSPDNNVIAHEYGVDETRELHDFTETPDVGDAGVYRGDGWAYPCD